MKCENPKILLHETPKLDRGEEHKKEITIRKGECLKYVFFPKADGVYERTFRIEEGGIFHGGAIIVGSDMVLKMTVLIEASHTEGHLQLLALATKGSNIDTSGVGRVTEGTEGVKLRVDQTNILLGSGARVRGMPVLEVATDSIEGGHSCRIQRISDESVFYLQSHGLSRETAEGLLLEAEIGRHVAIMEERAEEVKEEVLERLGVEK